MATRVEQWLYVVCDICGAETKEPVVDGIFMAKAGAAAGGWSIRANSTGRAKSSDRIKNIPCDICPTCVAQGHKHEPKGAA